ncbi:hypothetical protein GCM10008931_43960 [Oceanobacillus oncorhynchi subsp. oncorhynchi]|uniref:hypothetical protein n=1 Tax=Oceanobacillus oncorhynchi TaxID=545501 RepID=UPI0031D04EF8
MKTFECGVERYDKFRVILNESVFTEEWMEEFREFFFDYYTLEEHAQHIAQHRARFGRSFIEGYGVPLEDGQIPYWANKDLVNDGIDIVVLDEDNDIQVNTREVF